MTSAIPVLPTIGTAPTPKGQPETDITPDESGAIFTLLVDEVVVPDKPTDSEQIFTEDEAESVIADLSEESEGIVSEISALDDFPDEGMMPPHQSTGRPEFGRDAVNPELTDIARTSHASREKMNSGQRANQISEPQSELRTTKDSEPKKINPIQTANQPNAGVLPARGAAAVPIPSDMQPISRSVILPTTVPAAKITQLQNAEIPDLGGNSIVAPASKAPLVAPPFIPQDMNFPKTTDTREHPKGVGEVLLKSRMSFSPPIVQRESAPNVGQVQVMNPPDDLQSRSTLAKPVGNVVTLPDQMPFTVGEVFAAPRAAGSATVASSQTQIGAVPDARHVAQQVAAAVVRKGGGTTEIALKPAELGHVRLTLAAQDTAIVLSIQTERPEINDIMRRHIDVLAQEFRALGYSNVRFEFSGNSGAHPGDGHENASGDEPMASTEKQIETDEPLVAAPSRGRDGGLDLRV